MDGAFEPSFEVVDSAEEVEEYLLAKTRRSKQRMQLESREENSVAHLKKMDSVPPKAEETSRSDGAVCEEGLESSNECNDFKVVTEGEEGQEALWVDLTESTVNSNTSPKSKPASRRSSFLFGSKKEAVSVSKRSFSFRKKNQPQVILLGTSCDISTVEEPSAKAETDATQQPDVVVGSDTISSLGFDKSFDVKSPLSMSSLNEIMDAPLTPTETSNEPVTTGEPIKKKKSGIIRSMLQKKKKKKSPKSSRSALSFRLNRSHLYDPTVTFVENADEDDVYDPTLNSRELLTTVDVNERIQMALLQAMENDETQSLTSLTGVPVHSKMDDTEEKLTPSQGHKPLNFDKIKPNFIAASKDSLTLAEIQEKFVPLEDEESEEEEQEKVNISDSYDGENPEAEKFSSPNSTAVDSTATDRYTVAREPVNDSDYEDDDNKSDKYSVLPDPCSFCDSLWGSINDPQADSNKMVELPTSDKYDVDVSLESPSGDKYAELPEVLAVSSSGTSSPGDFVPPSKCFESSKIPVMTDEAPLIYVEPRSSSTKPPVASKSMAAGFFRKFKRPDSKTGFNVEMEPVLSPSECSTGLPSQKREGSSSFNVGILPRKSILKKQKELVVSQADVSIDASIIVPPVQETSDSKLSVISLSNDALPKNFTPETKGINHPVEDPSTEGSSEDETNLKVTAPSDPLLVRLRKSLQQSRAPTTRRGLDPQTEVDPIIVAGSRGQLDP